jgi:hypothetical protein
LVFFVILPKADTTVFIFDSETEDWRDGVDCSDLSEIFSWDFSEERSRRGEQSFFRVFGFS